MIVELHINKPNFTHLRGRLTRIVPTIDGEYENETIISFEEIKVGQILTVTSDDVYVNIRSIKQIDRTGGYIELTTADGIYSLKVV